MRRVHTGHSNARGGSTSSRGSTCKFNIWSQMGMVGTLGMYLGQDLKITWEKVGPIWRHILLTKNCLIHYEGMAMTTPERTTERSQEDMRHVLGGFSLLAPHRNLMIKSCFPCDLPSTVTGCAAMAEMCTFKVEGGSLRSIFSCKKKQSPELIRHLSGAYPGGISTTQWADSTSRNKLA